MKNQKINATLVNPFIKSAVDVFKQLFSTALTKKDLILKKDPTASYEVAIIIGISGAHHTGVVVFSMKKYTALKLVGVLDSDITEKNSEHFSDAIGELGNIISGNALSEFAKNKIEMNLTTPTVIIGDAFEMHLLEQTTLSAIMTSIFGDIEINVAIKEF